MSEVIKIKGARVHNLKNISIEIPKNKFTVVTGLSGSCKSSLAFDTIFAEGQRRYMESLSSYARQFLEIQDRPDADEISGLSPTIAIDQKSVSRNPRSTVGTITEIYDYLRLLFAKVGRPHCPQCGEPVKKQSVEEIGRALLELAKTKDVRVFSPIVKDARGEHRTLLQEIERAGYKELRLDNDLISLEEALDRHLDKNKKHVIEAQTLFIAKGSSLRLEEIRKRLENALDLGNGFVVANTGEADILLSLEYSCGRCGLSLPSVEPRLFSFNSPHGACEVCNGLGVTLTVDPELVVTNPRLTVEEGAIKPWRMAGSNGKELRLLAEIAKKNKFRLNAPFGSLSFPAKQVIFYGSPADGYEGVIPALEKKYRETTSEYVRKEIKSFMRELVCPACKGKRLKPEVLAVTIDGKSITDLSELSIEEALEWTEAIVSRKNGKKADSRPVTESLSDDEIKIAKLVLKDVRERLEHLAHVGVEYLSLDRSATTLSGGEAQRVRLATQLGSDLSGVIYILDEPSIGLHGRDNKKLIQTMKLLRDKGNTVIVVEHDAETIRSADFVIDVGPGAGEYGGEIVAKGSPKDITRNAESLTGRYLAGKKSVPVPKMIRKGSGKSLVIRGAKAYNLKNIDVTIPLGVLICVTGVSGSGKSTLILDVLGRDLAARFHGAKELPAAHKSIEGTDNLDKVIMIDQSAIGKTPRSNPATYTQVFTPIRDLYTETPEAKMRGYNAGKFSFNVTDGGRCPGCDGEGYVKIDMQFLPNVYVECKECHGTRYNSEAL